MPTRCSVNMCSPTLTLWFLEQNICRAVHKIRTGREWVYPNIIIVLSPHSTMRCRVEAVLQWLQCKRSLAWWVAAVTFSNKNIAESPDFRYLLQRTHWTSPDKIQHIIHGSNIYIWQSTLPFYYVTPCNLKISHDSCFVCNVLNSFL